MRHSSRGLDAICFDFVVLVSVVLEGAVLESISSDLIGLDSVVRDSVISDGAAFVSIVSNSGTVDCVVSGSIGSDFIDLGSMALGTSGPFELPLESGGGTVPDLEQEAEDVGVRMTTTGRAVPEGDE